MRKPSLIIEIRFLGKVLVVVAVLDILFSTISLASNSLQKQVKSESDLKEGEPKAQKLSGAAGISGNKIPEIIHGLIGRADTPKDKPEKPQEINISDVPLQKEGAPPVKEQEKEYDINDLRSDSPEMLSTPTAVSDKQNEVKKDNKNGSDLPDSISDLAIVPDTKNKEVQLQESPRATEGNEESEEKSGLINIGDGKKYEQSIVSLRVNYEESDILSTILKDQSNNLLVLAEDITPFDIKEEYLDRTVVNLNDKKYINLTSLEGTKYNLDSSNLALDITIPAEQMKMQYFNTTQNPITDDIYGKSTRGAFLNYDFL